MRSVRKYGLEIIGVFLLALITTFLLSDIKMQIRCDRLYDTLRKQKDSLEQFRVMDIDEKIVEKLLKTKPEKIEEVWQEITMAMLIGDYRCNESTIKRAKQILKQDKKRIVKLSCFTNLFDRYKTIWKDIRYFPVAYEAKEEVDMSFENSWGEPRSYGGKRRHEGTDIMPPVNERGRYPVISVSDGIIENIGWLEQGGYRIGVRSEAGGYYYYAHLYSYAPDLEKGDRVIAGQLLGFMGDTGYGKEEGTRGQFAVHLHFGIYYMEGEEEVSVNPYPVLKYLKHRIIRYSLE